MRYPVAVAATIISIALYFTLFWGFDALRILTSPMYGLEETWRSQIVYWVGRSFSLSPTGLLHLAAFSGGIKLIVAGVCGVHIADRIRCFAGGQTDVEIHELGLLLVIIVSIATVIPAVWEHDVSLIRTNTVNLVLAAIAAALSAIERGEVVASEGSRLDTAILEAEPIVDGKARNNWFAPWR